MRLTQLIAQLLWIASLDIPRPEFHRYELARKNLLRAMRGPARSLLDAPYVHEPLPDR